MSAPPGGIVPVIETERLTLRRHDRDDFGACAAMWGDPNVTSHIGGSPVPPEEVWAKILRYRGLWEMLGFGYWAIAERSSGAFVGELGFADFKRDIAPSLDGIPELGWALAVRFHGRGYASEAVRAALGWADRHLAAARTACLINPGNAPSIRVAEKCGYGNVLPAVYRGRRVHLFFRDALAA